jgi:hypothetical protein
MPPGLEIRAKLWANEIRTWVMALAATAHETGQSNLQNIAPQKERVISVLAQP